MLPAQPLDILTDPTRQFQVRVSLEDFEDPSTHLTHLVHPHAPGG
jgi:hypothetical protein